MNPYFLRNPGQRAGHSQPVVGLGVCTGKGEALQLTAAVSQAAQPHPRRGHPQLVDSSHGTGLRSWYVEHKPLFDRSTHSDCTPWFVDYIPALCHQQPIYPPSEIRFLGWELCPRLCLLHGDRHILVLLELNFHDQGRLLCNYLGCIIALVNFHAVFNVSHTPAVKIKIYDLYK